MAGILTSDVRNSNWACGKVKFIDKIMAKADVKIETVRGFVH